jgi:hypothetical protein
MKGSVKRKHLIEVILRFIGKNWDMSIWLIMFETIKVITSDINWDLGEVIPGSSLVEMLLFTVLYV